MLKPVAPPRVADLTRRGLLGASLALGACRAPAQQFLPAGSVAPLRRAAPFRIGSAVRSEMLAQPAGAAFFADQVSQLTPEWEMKMEYILRPDFGLRFDAPDAIARFARHHGMALFGHTLVWHQERPAPFADLDDPVAFRRRFAAYIGAVVGHYAGAAIGWDVVNEPVAEDGDGWRNSLWSERLGPFEHMRLAFDLARAADPHAVLFLNEYNLELLPAKRLTFLRLAERLLRAGAPLQGLGSQTHIAADLPPGAISDCIADLARLGLKVRVSEMDVSLSEARLPLFDRAQVQARQCRLYAEAAAAMLDAPAAQRFDITFWGLRDDDSWLLEQHPGDAPLPFDSAGRPKPALLAFETALEKRGRAL